MSKPVSDWQIRSLASLGTYLNGFAFKPQHWGESGLPIVRIRELLDPTVEPDRYEGPIAQSFSIDDGDLIFSWSGTLAALFWDRGPAYLNQHLFKVSAAPDVDVRFLHHFIKFHLDGLAARSHGTTMKHVTRRDLKDYLIELPSTGEQRQMADVLDAISEQIRATERVIAKIDAVRLATLETLLKRANPLLRTRRLESATTRIVDGVHHTPTYVDSGVPFITVENLTRGPGISLTPCRYVSHRAHSEYRRRIEPLPGDVLVSKDGTLGVARLVPEDFPAASIFVSVAVLRPLASVLSGEFLRLFFDTNEFRRQLRMLSAGSGLQHIHLEHFREFLIPDLDVAEQESIACAIAMFDERLAAERSVLEKLKLQRIGLMTDLLTGRVRVSREAAP
ncbi:Type I site-specific deoxyribonuclease [Micromonospora saelicesensis]|uniref:restriction endonuclease subunit S n=1 Tax=Micromonospora saelicesensis TaxID=285676 RepID=UPI000DBFAA73|nr:restriction endonuclease subunit S [Micromonospora saelicesensis]RAO63424.1 Type I site-specific deoxyribonuclease [Micromonospora saelicesensis]